ncbi:MAG TPA: RES family NAD+ phosphorylase [Longimicrobiales bacterium]|nr:RES family NAD+ phosphorylase [Longimicrobiales bacterium]
MPLFERVSSDPAVWEALIAAEMLVNPRIRNDVGEIHLVPPDERVSGPGASYVMAAFTHLNPRGSRFSDGTYGVYYAGREFETALRETAWHFARIAADSADGPRHEDMRVLVGRIETRMHDVRTLPPPEQALLLDPDSYAASQRCGARLREQVSNGIVYPSVRHRGGRCVGAFRPPAVGIPVQASHLQYHYDGTRVVEYFDYERASWIALPE